MSESLLERIINQKGKTESDDWPSLLQERMNLVLKYFKTNGIDLPKLGSVECLYNRDDGSSGYDNLFFSCDTVISDAGISLNTEGIFWLLNDETRLPQKKSWTNLIDEYILKRILGFTSEGEWVSATVLCYDVSCGPSAGFEKPVEIQICRVNIDDISRQTQKTTGDLWRDIGHAISGFSINYGNNREWIPGTSQLAEILKGEKQLLETCTECTA